MVAIARGSVYIERTAVNTPKNVRATKKAITKAFRIQMEGLGFSLVEILSPCPTNWKLSAIDAAKRVTDTMTKIFPLKTIKDEVGKI